MIFGIDLGTTNSLIGFGDVLYSGLVSSSVDVSTRKQVARDVISEDIVSSYKTDMSMSKEGQLAINCSKIILRTLADIAQRRSGVDASNVIISVPAYFSTTQREAVYTAAQQAGLTVHGLINEPTAAALYVCRDSKDLVLVYDLGGGTFDITVIDSRLGNYKVVATDGLVLGGDDLDEALMEYVMDDYQVKRFRRSKMAKKILLHRVRQAKEEIQRTKSDVYISLDCFNLENEKDDGPFTNVDFVLTVEKYKEIVRNVFGKTIQLAHALICKSIPAYEKLKVVFVGGSSYCPYLRDMVIKELELQEVQADINPDLIVARGVALYAEMVEKGVASKFVEDVTKRLCIEDSTGASQTIVEADTMVPCCETLSVSNPVTATKLEIKLYQGSAVYAKDNDYIGTLVYDYEREVKPYEGMLEVQVIVDVNGVVKLGAFELIYGEEAIQEIELTAR